MEEDSRFCRSCLAFFYNGDPEADHPPSETENLQQFFCEAGITSVTRLTNFLWAVLPKTSEFMDF